MDCGLGARKHAVAIRVCLDVNHLLLVLERPVHASESFDQDQLLLLFD